MYPPDAYPTLCHVALGLELKPGLVPNVDESEYIAPSAMVVGDVSLSEGVSVWYGAVMRGDSGKIVVGARTNIQDGAILHGETTVGRHVTIGHGATVHECHVGNVSLIGIRSVVLSGARVSGGCIVAAGSVVRENSFVPENSLVAGVPARVVRKTTPEERAHLLAASDTYVRLARSHRLAWARASVGNRDGS